MEEVLQMMSCSICGNLVSSQASFCNYCGSPLHPFQLQIQVSPPPSVCFYHPYLAASYVCSRCGRSICTYCLRPYGGLNLCPICFTSLTGLPAYYVTAPIVVPVYAARSIQAYRGRANLSPYTYSLQNRRLQLPLR